MVATPSRSRTPALAAKARAQQVSGNPGAVAGSAAIYRQGRRIDNKTDRRTIAQPWQTEAYRHVNICGEARYAASLFAAMAGRAEIGVADANSLAGKASWVKVGAEVDVLNEIAPTVRERTALIRSFMLHYVIAGECYLISRKRLATDPGYVDPPDGFDDWDAYLATVIHDIDLMDPEADRSGAVNPNEENPVWEIVAVTELRKTAETWSVRIENENFVDLTADDPVIRLWSPDPNNRTEAWSPFRSLLPTLREIEWLTKHIFTQVRSRLLGAGVWFLPNNLTFPPPPPDAVEGGAEAIAHLNEAELFMLSLAATGTQQLDADEVGFPSIVMADALALDAIDKNKLIQFWSEIDDKAMVLRSDAVRRFALGMDLPPEQVLGSSGLAVTGAGGSAGSVNHWGVWANEEQTISAHIEPALDVFVGTLTASILRLAVEGTDKVFAYNTATLRLRQDRSKEALELHDRGLLNAETTLREVGFDPATDKMSDEEFRKWLLVKLAGGSATPEQVQAAFALLGVTLPVAPSVDTGPSEVSPQQPGRNQAPSLEDHPYEGPPREQHDHSDAPFGVQHATAEMLVLRALEKYGNRVLNDGKRGRDRDRTTPPHLAHVASSAERPVSGAEFDLSMASVVLADVPSRDQDAKTRQIGEFCAHLVNEQEPYTRDALIEWMGVR